MEKKSERIEMIRAYIGNSLMTWWGIWSYGVYGIPFSEPLTFVRTIGGIIG